MNLVDLEKSWSTKKSLIMGGRIVPILEASSASTSKHTKADRNTYSVLESVRKHQAGLQSFRSMRRIEASRRNASALRLRFSQSFASLRQRLSQAKVRSTTQRRGSTTNPFVRS